MAQPGVTTCLESKAVWSLMGQKIEWDKIVRAGEYLDIDDGAVPAWQRVQAAFSHAAGGSGGEAWGDVL